MSGASTETQAHKWLRRVTGAVIISAVLLVSFVPVLPWIIHFIIVPDFTMLWTGGRFALHSPSLLYDVDAVTAAQQGLREGAKTGPLPFIYPPTTLLLLVPFGLIPFWPAFVLWTGAGVATFWTAARSVTTGRIALLSLLTPPAVTVLFLGQTTFLVGAAILWSIALIKERPVLSGVLMGVAAAIKPQTAILAPVAYVAGRNWAALIAAACTWLALASASLAFGPGLWLDWIRALPAFPAMLADWNLHQHGATPLMLARFLELPPVPFVIVGLLVGVVCVWIGTRSDDLKIRALAFVGGTLLASPYAMSYELAMAAPMLIAAALTTTLMGLVIAAPLVAVRVYAIVPTLLISVPLAVWRHQVTVRSERRP